MHILFFINSLSGGGAERVTVNLANNWAEKGWQITIVTLAEESMDAYELSANINRIALNMSDSSPSLISALANNFHRLRALRKCLRREKPDVAIAMMTTANCLLALAGRHGTTRLIGSERTYPPQYPLGRIWETARRKLYHRLDVMVALTEESRDWLFRNTNSQNIEVIPNPAPFPLVASPPRIMPFGYLRNDRKVALSVGSLVKLKAFDRLIEAFARLANDFSEWDLVIVGEGPERDALLSLAQEQGIGERLILPGRAGNIADWYMAADAFAMTSLFEGFPNVLVEAMAHGLPVLSVDCDTGPRDIINDCLDGLLVAQDDALALDAGLRQLLGDKNLRRGLSANATAVRDRFSLERIAAKWEKIF